MTLTLSALQKQRRDTAANWTAENPTLLAGEIGIEADTGKIKIGNGSTAWASLGYQGIIPASGAYPLNQLIMPLGTAGAPTLTFTGDTNTGLYSPGADQLALATGGTGRLFVDASGNVGVGSTPSVRLDVRQNQAAYSYFDFYNTTAGGGIVWRQIVRNLADTGTTSIDLVKYTSGGFAVANNDTGAANFTAFNVGASERLRITSAGLVGIGTGGSTPNGTLETKATAGVAPFVASGPSSEYARVDSSGRLLVGTSSALEVVSGFNATTQQNIGTDPLALFRYSGNIGGPVQWFCKSRGANTGNHTVVQNNDILGQLTFTGSDGTNFVRAAGIVAEVDGTPGANNMPGRIVLSTTAAGASSPTERMRITQNGYAKHANNGIYLSNTAASHEFSSTDTEPCIILRSTNASFANNVLQISATRAANSAYRLFAGYSDGFNDLEFGLYGDGNGKCDGSWTGGGADYAEFFEWSDSNPSAEDRRGISVVLDNDKIREAVAGEDPIGVISGNPSVVGDSAWNKWSGKYLRDEFGTYIQEDYEVADDDGNTVIQQRRKLNPAYDPDVEYISREQRPEWDCVGLMGKLRIRKGQVTGSRWIKMRDINESVEEWLVR